MGPLDMKGLLGAATVIGSLMYGSGHVFKGQSNFYLHKGSLGNSPSDAEFALMLAESNCLRSQRFPPLAIAEALQDFNSSRYKIRRLHLIVVDTWSPWQYNTSQVRAVTDQMKHLCNTPDMQRMVPMMPPGGKIPPRCRRFIYGYALDHSEFPCYLLWPCRDQGGYWLLDTMTNDALVLSPETHFRPLGLHHFYDAFSLDGRASVRQDALVQFELEEDELTTDFRLTPAALLRKEWALHQEQPKAPPARTARRDRVPPGVINPDQGEEEKGELEEAPDESSTDSGDSGDEQEEIFDSNTRTPLSEDIHQHGLMLAAYRAVGNNFISGERLTERWFGSTAGFRVRATSMAFSKTHYSIVEVRRASG